MKNKKKIKINFKYFWEGFDPEDNFFINLLRKQYDVKISDNPDFLFYSVFPELKIKSDLSDKGDFIKKISPKLYVLLRHIYSKIILLLEGESSRPLPPQGKYIKIFYGAEHKKPKMEECDWAFSSYFEEDIKNSRHMRLSAQMVSDYQLKNFGAPPLKKKIILKKIKKEKKKFCNFIYSQEILPRNNFFKMLNKYKKIDSPGRCMNNMAPIGPHENPKKSRMFKNWIEEKLDFIKDYKFTIAFENDSKSGWVTEKLTHPMLVNSIPIYFGHENIKKEFNTKSFINYNDFKDIDKFIEYIIKVDKDDNLYESILGESWYVGEKSSKKERILKRFKEIFG